MTPSEHFNLPIIGTIEVQNIGLPGSNTFEVISISGDNYITNDWYKEHNHTPLIVHKSLIIKFTNYGMQKETL